MCVCVCAYGRARVFARYCMCWICVFAALRTFAFRPIPSGESSLTSISLKITRSLCRWRCAPREGGRVRNHGGCEYFLVGCVKNFAHIGSSAELVWPYVFQWSYFPFCVWGLRLTYRDFKLMRGSSTIMCWTQERADWCFWSPRDPAGASPSLTLKQLPWRSPRRETQ